MWPVLKSLINRYHWQGSLIFDRERRLGDFSLIPSGYQSDLNKEDISRDFILGRDGKDMHFLDVGARDGALTYLLGMKENLVFDQVFYNKNRLAFDHRYLYYGMDLEPADDLKIIAGDICNTSFADEHTPFCNFFDVIYSNNVFEHLERPWIAAENLNRFLKVGGILITIVPFSQRYHESPGDFFRYTHKGIESLFSGVGEYEVLKSGYDIRGRRINWQGAGKANDIVPLDKFGAWRETWFTICVLRKL